MIIRGRKKLSVPLTPLEKFTGAVEDEKLQKGKGGGIKENRPRLTPGGLAGTKIISIIVAWETRPT